LIELERYDDALRELGSVEQQFKGRTAKDVQTGLRCKLALRRGNWREAEPLYTALHNKDLPVHKSLRAELLRQKSLDAAVPLKEREQAKEEAGKLVKELTAAGTAFSFVLDEPEFDN
jgi:hypothetical protein